MYEQLPDGLVWEGLVDWGTTEHSLSSKGHGQVVKLVHAFNHQGNCMPIHLLRGFLIHRGCIGIYHFLLDIARVNISSFHPLDHLPMYLFIFTDDLILWNQIGLLRYERVQLEPLLFVQSLIHDLTGFFYVLYDFVLAFLFMILGTSLIITSRFCRHIT